MAKDKRKKPTPPTVNETVVGYSGPPIKLNERFDDEYLFQCPTCGRVTESVSERPDITCRGCGTKYFKHAAQIEYKNLFDRAKERERRGDVDFDIE